MVDDQVRALNQRLPPDERASAITIIEHSGEPRTPPPPPDRPPRAGAGRSDLEPYDRGPSEH